jgi:hypothetical protein
MKKFILALMISLSSFGVTSNAHAGLLVTAITGNIQSDQATKNLVLLGGALGLVTGATVSIVSTHDYNNNQNSLGGGPGPGIFGSALGFMFVGFILDVDSNLNESELHQMLKSQFPFIDSNEAISSLTKVARDEIVASIQNSSETNKYFVQIPREKIIRALTGADLNSDQLEMVIQALE